MLYIQDGMSQDELSKMMRVDKSYIARAVANMEKMGMVIRKPDPHEHRIKRVYLGKNAREAEPAFFDLAKKWLDNLIKDIPSDNLIVTLNGLDQMMKNAETALGLEEMTTKLNRKSI
jgi:DNA-binding MarR family transcriptional regulator